MTRKISFALSMAVLIGLIIVGFFNPATASHYFEAIKTVIVSEWGWTISWCAGCLFIVELFLIFSSYGSTKLAYSHDRKPKYEYTNFQYWSMILACGIGVAPIFWSVLEPVAHIQEGMQLDDAMIAVIHNWMLGPGTFYGIVAISVSYLTYNREKRVVINSLFNNNYVNIVINSVLAVSIAVGLALTFMYVIEVINANFLSVYKVNVHPYALIAFVTVFTLLSSYMGISKGIKTVSYFTILTTIALIGYVYIGYFDQSNMLINTVKYWVEYIPRMFSMYFELPTEPARKDWLATWTYNYFSAWLGIAVLLGVFMAKISYGRTIRSVLISSLVIPSALASVWFVVFGESAVLSSSATTFDLLSKLPYFSYVLGAVAILCVFFFLVAHDSAGIVLEDLTVAHSRLIWVLIIAVLTAMMSVLPGNSVELLRNLTTIVSIPTLFVVFWLGYTMLSEYCQNEN